jgi:O-antigen/teichoic acid export membrane protein
MQLDYASNLSIMKNFKDNLTGKSGLLSIGFADIVGSAISGLFWLYIASQLNPDMYGELIYFISIAGLAQMVSLLGSSNALTVYTAKNVKIQSTLFLISILSAVISLAIITIFLNRLDAGLLAVGFIVFSLLNSVLLGKKLFVKYAKLVLSQKILTLILGLGLYFVFDAYGIIYGLALSYIPHLIIFVKEFSRTKIDFALLKPRKGFIINNYVMSLTAGLGGTVDKLIIAPVLGLILLGNYSLALQMFTIMMMFSAIVYKYLLPLDASGESNKKIRQIALVISIIITILGVTILPNVIDWLFPKYIDAKDAIQIMSLGVVPGTIAILYSSKLLGMEKSKFVMITKLVSLGVLIGGFLYFGPIYGTIGLAWIIVTISAWEAIFLFTMNRTLKAS